MITEVQYESLFAFCRKHYVQYYDVQVELVDHLAEAIEEKLKLNPKLNFEQALDSVYAGFGIKGFADIVATRMEMISKKSRKQKWKLFFAYFTIPKIAMTICLYATILFLGKFLTQDYFRGVLLSVLGLSVFIFEITWLQTIILAKPLIRIIFMKVVFYKICKFIVNFYLLFKTNIVFFALNVVIINT